MTNAAASRSCVLSLILLIVAGGCVERNVERIGSDEAARLPPPPPPAADAGSSSNQPTIAATRITGVVELAPELELPPGATLYLIVRVAGRETGAPLAVQQIIDASFPYEFEITEKDSMIPGTPLVGEMSVTARIDQDGNAFTATDGDLSGQTAPVLAGDSDVVVRLSERVSGTPSE